MLEAGVPGYVNASWGAVIVPAKTPKAIVDRLNRDIVAILNEPDTEGAARRAVRRGDRELAGARPPRS